MNSGWDFRHHRRQREVATLDDDSLPHEINPHLAIDPIGHREVLLHLEESLATLGPGQRTALWLIDVEGWSINHVARREGVRPGTIKSRRNRGREALRRALHGERAGNVHGNVPGAPGVEHG